MVSLIYGNNGNIGTNGLGYEEPLISDKTTSACSSSGSSSANKPKSGQNKKKPKCAYCKPVGMCFVCNKKKGKPHFLTYKRGPKKV